MSQNSNAQKDSTREAQNFELRKVALDSQKHLVTVSSGTLVLLATFLKDLFSDPQWGILISVTFLGLLVALLTGVCPHVFTPRTC